MTHVREMLDMKLKREDIKNKDVETIIRQIFAQHQR